MVAPRGAAAGGAPVLILALLAAGCGTAPEAREAPPPSPPQAVRATPATETIRATRWVATSAEYQALSLQAYDLALSALERALADSSWTALPEQEGTDYRVLPPAVILDVDETVLDNIAFQERLIEIGSDYDEDLWAEWVREASAAPVPGALAFTRRAAQRGVAVYYVTNRDAEYEEATLRNLVALGFPVSAGRDPVLTRWERPEWDGDKDSRRLHVAEDHRILLLVGDDLNDFVSARGLSERQRDRLVERHRSRWGSHWIVLPNPVYGSWQRATGG